MLVVSSSLDQSVMLEKLDGLEAILKVTVLGVRGTKVRLGFEVVSLTPACPSEVRERPLDVSPTPAANPGMDSTQVWEWSEKDDVEAKQHTDQ